MIAQISTDRYVTSRYSAMMNAAAPSVGGDRIAPMPDAASNPPAFSLGYPAFFSIGHVTAPSDTVVAVPEPETVPSRNPAVAAVRPGAVRDFRKAAKLMSTKNFPAPEAFSTAP